jgi:hypothetical protein
VAKAALLKQFIEKTKFAEPPTATFRFSQNTPMLTMDKASLISHVALSATILKPLDNLEHSSTSHRAVKSPHKPTGQSKALLYLASFGAIYGTTMDIVSQSKRPTTAIKQ